MCDCGPLPSCQTSCYSTETPDPPPTSPQILNDKFPDIQQIHISPTAYLESRVRQQPNQTLPLLLRRRQDLRRRQHKPTGPTASARTQLNRPRQLRLAHILDVIRAAPRRGIQRAAARSHRPARATHGSDPRPQALRQRQLLSVVGRARLAVVAIRQKDVLPVAVPVDVELDAFVGSEGGGEGREGLHLGRVAGGLAFVGLGAGGRGGAAGELPLVGPVAVDVGADAGLTGAGLAVLAPETVVGLGVDEAWVY